MIIYPKIEWSACRSYVLDVTARAMNAINDIFGFAVSIVFVGFVYDLCCSASNFGVCDQDGAEFAAFICAI